MKTSVNIWIMAAMAVLWPACKEVQVSNPDILDRYPDIYPDYVGITIPVNIAPTEFAMAGCQALTATFEGRDGQKLEASGRTAVHIDPNAWKRLLRQHADDSLRVTVHALKDGRWLQYKPFPIYVKSDSIDYGLVYRLIAPGYQVYSRMGIYERCLSDFSQRPLFENTQVTNSCVNCHTFNKGNPHQQSVHVRGKHGATLIVRDGKMEALKSTTDSTLASCVYPYWHPSGKYVAYSTNLVRQMFHTTSENLIETMDLDSDVLVYDIEHNKLISCNLTAGKPFETNPSFSADGKTLYFCSAAPRNMPQETKDVRYDLCSIAFDPDDGTFGEKVDTLVHAAKNLKSVSLPRESYDGRFLMYTLADYGNFASYHKESDLWLMDLRTKETRPLDEVNSRYADSYHNWGTNSRWFVFGSRRHTNLYTRAYIAHMDKDGKAGKPFLLPQENPYEYYQDLFLSYNCLEFVTAPVPFDAREAEFQLMSTHRIQMEVKRNN